MPRENRLPRQSAPRIPFIQGEAKAQTQAGADYIDVNAGTFVGEEADKLKWIVEAVQEVTDLPAIDRRSGSRGDHLGDAAAEEDAAHQFHHPGAVRDEGEITAHRCA